MNYTDEQMDEIVTIEFPSIVACLMCGAFVPGLTVAEAAEDARNLGWERRGPTWRCADCLNEEMSL